MSVTSKMSEVEGIEGVENIINAAARDTKTYHVPISSSALMITTGTDAQKHASIAKMFQVMDNGNLWGNVEIAFFNAGMKDEHLAHIAKELEKRKDVAYNISFINNTGNSHGSPSQFSQEAMDNLLKVMDGSKATAFPFGAEYANKDNKEKFIERNPNTRDIYQQKKEIAGLLGVESLNAFAGELSLSEAKKLFEEKLNKLPQENFDKLSELLPAMEALSKDYNGATLGVIKQGSLMVDNELYKYMIDNKDRIAQSRKDNKMEGNMAENETNTPEPADKSKYPEEFWEKYGENIDMEGFLKGDKDVIAAVESFYEQYKKEKDEAGKEGEDKSGDDKSAGDKKDGEEKTDDKPKEGEENSGDKPKEDKGNTLNINEGIEEAKEEVKTPEWVLRYDERLKKHGDEHEDAWTRDLEVTTQLAGSTKSGMKLHYPDENNLSFDGKVTENNFGGVIKNAVAEGQTIALSDKVTPENRQAIIEIAAKYGATIDNLKEDEKELYESIRAKADEDKSKQPEVKEDEPKAPTPYIAIPKSAEIHLKKFDRMADGTDDQKFELDATLARFEGAKDVSIGGDNKESEMYTLAAYAKTSKLLEHFPDNQEVKSQVEMFERVMGKYGIEISKTEADGKTDFSIKEKKDAYRESDIAEDIKSLNQNRYSGLVGANKYNEASNSEQFKAADKVMEIAKTHKGYMH